MNQKLQAYGSQLLSPLATLESMSLPLSLLVHAVSPRLMSHSGSVHPFLVAAAIPVLSVVAADRVAVQANELNLSVMLPPERVTGIRYAHCNLTAL